MSEKCNIIIVRKENTVCYNQRMKKYQQNNFFRVHQKRFLKEISGECRDEKLILDNIESQSFWTGAQKDFEWLHEL